MNYIYIYIFFILFFLNCGGIYIDLKFVIYWNAELMSHFHAFRVTDHSWKRVSSTVRLSYNHLQHLYFSHFPVSADSAADLNIPIFGFIQEGTNFSITPSIGVFP